MIRLQKNSIEAEKHSLIAVAIIRKRIDSLLARGYIGRTPRIHLTVDTTNYLNYLLNNDNLKNLILTKPEDYNGLIAGIYAAHPNFVVPNSNENLILRNVFIAHGYE